MDPFTQGLLGASFASSFSKNKNEIKQKNNIELYNLDAEKLGLGGIYKNKLETYK